jgi:hypothetical protein
MEIDANGVRPIASDLLSAAEAGGIIRFAKSYKPFLRLT